MPYIRPDHVREPLFAIVPYSNYWQWKSREKHTVRAIKHFIDSGAVVYLVEAAHNRREFTFANSGLNGSLADCGVIGADHNFRHRYIGLRTRDELWLKENLINVGVQHLTLDYWDWQQVCWLDSDIQFTRPNWVGTAIHRLQHGMHQDIAFLQMFSQARDLNPEYEMLPEIYPHADGISFIQSWRAGELDEALKWRPISNTREQLIEAIRQGGANISELAAQLDGEYYGARRVFPGLAWACTRKAWDEVGGLPDFCIWGGADWSMAHALVGKRQNMMHAGLHPNYKSAMSSWADNADKHVRQNVLVMTGVLHHNWHGKKTSRAYGDKHRILAQLQFDPVRHLKRDAQGLHQLHDDGSDAYVQIRDTFRKIAHERSEDSIDV